MSGHPPASRTSGMGQRFSNGWQATGACPGAVCSLVNAQCAAPSAVSTSVHLPLSPAEDVRAVVSFPAQGVVAPEDRVINLRVRKGCETVRGLGVGGSTTDLCSRLGSGASLEAMNVAEQGHPREPHFLIPGQPLCSLLSP